MQIKSAYREITFKKTPLFNDLCYNNIFLNQKNENKLKEYSELLYTHKISTT